MEIILCKINKTSEEKLVAEEVASIENFISYNNVLSLEPKLSLNDWELQVSSSTFEDYGFEMGDWIYIVDSEYGGIIENIEHVDGLVKLNGANFRGYLTRHIIVPRFIDNGPKVEGSFSDYLNIVGDANEVVWNLFTRNDSGSVQAYAKGDPYVVGLIEPAGITVSDKFRFVQYLQGVTKMLRANGLRLETKQVYVENNTQFVFPPFQNINEAFIYSISAQPVTDYSEDENFSSDFDIRVYSGIKTDREVKYLFALGSGELENREIVVLVKYGDSIEVIEYSSTTTQGSLWDAAIYEYPNAESREELIESAKDYFKENFTKDEYIELDVEGTNIEFFLGDIIQAEDFVTGLSTKAEITVKELTINENGTEIIYKVGGS